MEEHKQMVQSRYLLKSEIWITNHHNDTFTTWLQKEVMANDEIHEQLAWQARGPANSILMYQRYEINGYTFYTRSQDNKSTNQNSGVRIDATNSSGHQTHILVTLRRSGNSTMGC